MPVHVAGVQAAACEPAEGLDVSRATAASTDLAAALLRKNAVCVSPAMLSRRT